jgi:hypothetical protein
MGSLHEYRAGDLVKCLKSRDDDFSVEAWGTAAVGFLMPIANVEVPTGSS